MYQKAITLIFLFTFIVGLTTQAADNNNKFAGQGVGLANCSQFVEARNSQSKDYYLFGGWIDGYFSARNQVDKNTYSLVPWQSTDILAAFLTDYCRVHPDTQFQRAVMIMAQALSPHRLTQSSERISIEVNDKSGEFFDEIIQRVQKELSVLGYYKEDIKADFSEHTIKAIADFQKVRGIPISGFPDQMTLYQLFDD